MNTIGIDYQQTLSVVCLGEGSGATSRVRNVGDGLRPLIPNAIQGDTLWGSRALTEGGKLPTDLQDGPWLTEPDASRFWGHLYHRLYAFLGRIAPTAQNGYRTVVGLQAAHYAAAAEGVERLCAQAGFGSPTCLPATDAVLTRHLAEQRLAVQGATTVVVVVAGDTSTAVCSYRLQREAGSAPRIVTRDSVARSLPFGQAHWTGRLLVHINDLFTEPIRPGYELALRDAALEFGARLRRAPSGRAVGWTGPLRDKLYAPLQLTPEECYAWPEAAPVMSGLPGLIRDSLSAVNHAGRPDLILVGGIGAFWPFAAEAARSSGRVQQSESPEEDVARGAAWWPEVEAVWSDALFSVASAQSAPLPDWLADTSFAPEAASTDSEAGGFFFPVEELPAFAGFGQESLPVLEDTSFSTSGDVVTQTPTGADLFGLPAAETELYPSLLSSSESEKDTDVSLFASAQTPAQRPEYDILAPESTPVHAEEEDLDSLPPWDPRRNES